VIKQYIMCLYAYAFVVFDLKTRISQSLASVILKCLFTCNRPSLTNGMILIRVTTHLENLEKSGNSKVVRENGKSQGK